jgi:hypothetical protein
MAKASWVKVDPSQGSGNATVNVSSLSEHSGRKVRTTILTWKAANVEDIQRTVKQAGKPEFVDIADSISADKEGKVVTIGGITNSQKLTFSFGIGDLVLTLPSTYNANSVSTNNGSIIDGDPGALSQFPFTISITVPANTEITSKTRQLIVTDEAGNQDVCIITSAAGDAYVTIAEGDIELDYIGSPVTVQILSNTNWTIE